MSTREFVKPTRTPSDIPQMYEWEDSHPAFGLVTVSQTSGGKSRLFGSDLGHSTAMRIQVHSAVMCRGLSSDRASRKEPLVEFELSAAQWARFVSSSGSMGTPCTISARRMGEWKDMPQIAAPEASKREVHGEEMATLLRKRLDGMREAVDALGAMLAAGKVGMKDLRELHKNLDREVSYVPGGVKFVYDQFAEATEAVAEDAKAEVEAHVMGMATHLGLEELRKMAPQIRDDRNVGA